MQQHAPGLTVRVPVLSCPPGLVDEGWSRGKDKGAAFRRVPGSNRYELLPCPSAHAYRACSSCPADDRASTHAQDAARRAPAHARWRCSHEAGSMHASLDPTRENRQGSLPESTATIETPLEPDRRLACSTRHAPQPPKAEPTRLCTALPHMPLLLVDLPQGQGPSLPILHA